MLTRAGVAKRLGKSIATVRRMEGVELHPSVDTRGVRRFNPEEVERIARGEGGGRPKPHRIAALRAHKRDEGSFLDQSAWPGEDYDAPLEREDPTALLVEARAFRETIRRENEALRERHRSGAVQQEEERRAALERRRKEEREAAAAEKEALAAEMLETLESASDRELAAIGEDGLQELIDLLEDDE